MRWRSARVLDHTALLTVCFCLLALVGVCESVPVSRQHRWTHNHHRPADMSRERRAPHQRGREASVKAAENLTLCPHEVRVDFNKFRIPQRIEHVVCKQASCKCNQVDGDYTCTQLYSEMEVAHVSEDTGDVFSREKVQVKYGCFCATRSGVHVKAAEKPKLSQ